MINPSSSEDWVVIDRVLQLRGQAIELLRQELTKKAQVNQEKE